LVKVCDPSLTIFGPSPTVPQNFTFEGKRIGFAALEVNEPERILAKAEEIILELRLLKKVRLLIWLSSVLDAGEKELDFALLAVWLHPQNQRSDLIITRNQSYQKG
jgi:hypothetical protein